MGASYGLGSLLGVDQLIRCASLLGQDDSVWIAETWGMESVSMVAAVSQRSVCRRICTSILNVYSRSPAVLAMGAATLDTLAAGRFVLGLGASSAAIVGGLHGMPYSRPIRRVRECVDIVRLALSGEKINYTGEIYTLKGFTLLVRPRRRHIPIYLAAVNHHMLKLAWDVADGIILYMRPSSEIKKTIQLLQSLHGKRHIQVACQVITAVSEDAHTARQRARRTLAFYVSVGDVYRKFLAANGYARQTAAIREGYIKGGLDGAQRMVPDAMLHDLTVCGTPDECRASLARFVEAGVDEPILQFNPVGNIDESFVLLRRITG